VPMLCPLHMHVSLLISLHAKFGTLTHNMKFPQNSILISIDVRLLIGIGNDGTHQVFYFSIFILI